MKEIIVQSILSSWDKIEWRKGAVGMYGFDILADSSDKLWLIEINKCPTMEYSTAITKKEIPLFMEGLTDLMVEKEKRKETFVGGFEKVFEVPKLRDLSDYNQTKKEIAIEGKGVGPSDYLHRGKNRKERL